MFESNDSLDSLLISFLKKVAGMNEESEKSLLSLQFLEKMLEICEKY